MIAEQLTNGQYFKLANETTILKCVDDNRPADWQRYPGVVYQNTETGMFGGLGGYNNVELCSAPERATEKQVAYLHDLGYTGDVNLSKKLASKLIDKLKSASQPACHYCGMPATGHGFFGEPACSECGG